MARVKICGVNSPEAFDAAVQAGADWVGFVFHPASPRAVTGATAASLSARQAGGPQRVGLFVNPAPAAIDAVLGCLALDILQIYGAPEQVAEAARQFGLPVWRSVAVAPGAPLPMRAGEASALLVEPPAPPGATRPGGNAVALDWRGLAGWAPPFPWLLAGGLTPENVARAVAESGARAVDVSSGVETAPGVKSSALIRRFVMQAKAAAENDDGGEGYARKG